MTMVVKKEMAEQLPQLQLRVVSLKATSLSYALTMHLVTSSTVVAEVDATTRIEDVVQLRDDARAYVCVNYRPEDWKNHSGNSPGRDTRSDEYKEKYCRQKYDEYDDSRHAYS